MGLNLKLMFVFFLLLVSISFVLGATYEGNFGVSVGGGSIVIGTDLCQEDWSGSDWGSCINEVQTFICFDKNICGTENLIPTLCGTQQACSEDSGGGGSSSGGGSSGRRSSSTFLGGSNFCTEDWLCSGWSNTELICGTRVCNDLNNCGTKDLKPITEFDCSLISNNGITGNTLGGISFLSKVQGSAIGVLIVLIITLSILINLQKKHRTVVKTNQPQQSL